ncbi:hypothetical protein ABGB07_44030 [Micromonosporaceae bacterium B7E4]
MFRFEVTPDEGDAFFVQSDSRDVLRWEKTTKGASAAQLNDNIQMAALYKIAFIAATRHKQYVGTLAEFEEQHAIEVVDDDEDEDGDGLDPIQPAASTTT